MILLSVLGCSDGGGACADDGEVCGLGDVLPAQVRPEAFAQLIHDGVARTSEAIQALLNGGAFVGHSPEVCQQG